MSTGGGPAVQLFRGRASLIVRDPNKFMGKMKKFRNYHKESILIHQWIWFWFSVLFFFVIELKENISNYLRINC